MSRVGVREVVLEHLEEAAQFAPQGENRGDRRRRHNEPSKRAKDLGQPRRVVFEDDERNERSDGNECDAQLEEQRSRERDPAPA